MLTEKQRKILKITAVILVKKIIRKKRLGRRPDTDSALKGFAYVQEILNGNATHCLEILRMNKQAYLRICEHLKNKTWLKDSRYIKVEVKGFAYVQEILNGNATHCLEILRMNKQAYLRICEHLKNKTWLKDSRYIKVEEKMAMFLMTLNHNVRNRVTKRRFNHSTQTIHH